MRDAIRYSASKFEIKVRRELVSLSRQDIVDDDKGRFFEGMAGSEPRRSLLRELCNVVLLIALRFAIWSTVADAHGQREYPFRRREL